MNQPIDRNSPEFKFFCKVSRILYSHDLMGIGYEEDEYDPEAKTIIPRLKDCQNTDECENVVREEFIKWFTENSAKDLNYREVSKEIWEAWQSFQENNTNI